MEWDYRNRKTYFTGILMQEYDTGSGKLIGPILKIFKGTELDRTEAPHIYKRNGWYYLVCAEGGTGFVHAVTIARSRSLKGSYEVHPENPILTGLSSRKDLESIMAFNPEAPGSWQAPEGFYQRPQKAGQPSMCELEDDEWVLVHLSARPLPGTVACPLGRETSIQRLLWGNDDWPRVVDREGRPSRLAPPSVTFRSIRDREPELKVSGSQSRYGLYASRTKGKWPEMPHVMRLAPAGWKAERLKASESIQSWYEESAVSDQESRSTWQKPVS